MDQVDIDAIRDYGEERFLREDHEVFPRSEVRSGDEYQSIPKEADYLLKVFLEWTPGGTSSDIEDRRDDSGGGSGFGGGGFGGVHLGLFRDSYPSRAAWRKPRLVLFIVPVRQPFVRGQRRP